MSGPVAGQYITFTGQLANGKRQPEEYTLQILAGEGAPTVAGGWPEWLTINRPQRVGMTVLQGYPPVKLTIPIRFEAITTGARTRPDTGLPRNIEREIQILEWMGGRGRPLGTHPKPGGTFAGTPGHDALGDSPLIQLQTESPGSQNPLIPVQFQAGSMSWVVDGEAGGISFDANPLRDAGGARVRQLATIYLKQYVPSPGSSADSAAERAAAKAGGAGKGRYYKTTSALNTVKRLVQHIIKGTGSAASTQAVKETIAANRGNKKIGTNPNKPLAAGTRVFIPYDVEHHLSGG